MREASTLASPSAIVTVGRRRSIAGEAALAALLMSLGSQFGVLALEIPVVEIGRPGNAADDTGAGAINRTLQMAKFEVSNAQYAEFLNAVDPDGANALELYSQFMTIHYLGGLSVDGLAAPGNKYQVKPGLGQRPITFVDVYDTFRFANWMHNGQGSGDTENGAYTLLGGTPEPINGMTVQRNPEAQWFLPSEDEWYKAAYYDPAGGRYFDYATGTDTLPDSDDPPGDDAPSMANVANIFRNDEVLDGVNDGYAVTGAPLLDFTSNYYTDVGAYSAASSPFGTFDQNGNVFEWNEASSEGGMYRGIRGGAFDGPATFLHAGVSHRHVATGFSELIGFRLAKAPEPSMPGDFSGDRLLDAQDIDELTGQSAAGTHLSEFDLNTDGLVNDADVSLWIQDLFLSWIGDSNLDGEFNSGDLVQVFGINEYEDVTLGNSRWSDGDWNGDGDFTTSDLILAFQSGGYEQGPRAAVNAVPEPYSGLALAAAVLTLLPLRRRAARGRPRRGSARVAE